MSAVITLADRPPPVPQSDFAFEIDFQRGVGPASRVFAATHDFIRACETLDAALVSSIDAGIQTVLVLEDVESGSIKTWLKTVLETIDDSAIKELDWKKVVGAYLVKAKYVVLRWADDETKPRSLPDLRREIQTIAAQTDVRHLPDYSAPSPESLTSAIRDFQAVKDKLVGGDKARFISAEGSLDLNLSVRFSIDDLEALAVARIVVSPPAEMILAVKKPDYLGTSQWELRHGKRTISARIDDVAWLERFQNRELDVRPGDALRALVRIEHKYGHDNELMSERYTIAEVLETLVDQYRNADLFLDAKPHSQS